MQRRSETTKFGVTIGRRRFAWMLGACLAAVSLPTGAARAGEVQRAKCDLHAVHLTKQGDGSIPPELSFIERELRDDQFAAYKGFRLLERKELNIVRSKPAKAAFRTGHTLGLTLMGGDAKRLRIRAALSNRSGDRDLVRTTYAIDDGGVFLLGGPSYNGGKLLFAIRCRGVRG